MYIVFANASLVYWGLFCLDYLYPNSKKKRMYLKILTTLIIFYNITVCYSGGLEHVWVCKQWYVTIPIKIWYLPGNSKNTSIFYKCYKKQQQQNGKVRL